jgi:hypothetical protein
MSNNVIGVVQQTLQPAQVSLWLREQEREVKA